MADKGCYRNASILAERRGWTYWEGWALARAGRVDIPIQHAWCFDGEQVIETTWSQSALGYLGIPLDTRIVARVALDLHRFGSVLEALERDARRGLAR